MNYYKLSCAGINTSDALKRFYGNANVYDKLLQSFLRDDSFAQMCAAIKDNNVEKAFSAAHSLKGVSGNLSFTKLYNDIKPLVEILRSGTLENTEALLNTVVADYDAVVKAIKDNP